MAQSALQKASLVFRTRIHSLLDKQIDANAAGAIRTHLRDIENQLEEIDNSAADRSGDVTTIRRQIGRNTEQQEEFNKNIELLLGDDDPKNDENALEMQVQLQHLEQEEEDLVEQLAEAEKDTADLDKSVSLLRARYADMANQLRRLESMERAAKAKESVADTVRNVAEMTGGLDSVSVDNAVARLESRVDRASARFDRAMGTMEDSASNQVAVAEAKRRIAERLAKKTVGAAPASAQ